MPGNHHVLLDGGYGSLGLSVIEEKADPVMAAAGFGRVIFRIMSRLIRLACRSFAGTR